MAATQARFRGAVLGPIAALYAGFLILPLGFFLLISFFKYSSLEMYLPQLTLENYTRFLFDGYYRGVLWTTIRVAFLTAVFCVLLGYPLAYFLARHPSRWRGVLMFLVIAPLMSGVIVRTYAWILLLGREGTVNKVLTGLGIVGSPVPILHTELAVVIALVHILLPYMVFPVYSAIAVQDRDLERAAFTLGAGAWRGFLEVTLPLSRPGLVNGSVLVFTLSAGAVVTPALLGGKDVQTLGMTVYELVTATLNWPLAAAFASILVLCQFALIAMYFRGAGDAFRRGE